MSMWDIPSAYKTVQVEYSSLGGVDLAGDSRGISRRRASRISNMFRKYDDGGTFIESRPGYKKAGEFPGKIYGIHFGVSGFAPLVHAGTGLYLWSAYPMNPADDDLVSLFTLRNARSVSFCFNGRLYILDGAHYICYDGQTVSEVTGFVPTTHIGALPSGGGEKYQAVNLLSDKRKNSFRGNGTDRVFRLDAKNIGDVVSVKVAGTAVAGFTYNSTAGTVTLPTAPAEPPLGEDNVVIEFEKDVNGDEFIKGCSLCRVFDNRVFLSGNTDSPCRLIHSALNDPSYFADTDYYDDGGDTRPISALAVKDNTLVVLRTSGSGAVFTHEPSLDYELGRVYPAREGVVTTGCDKKGCALAFLDDLVYLSNGGLEGITNTLSEAAGALHHRSSLIDAALCSEDELSMAQWQGYLCILAKDRMYLADSRDIYQSNGSFEYEWYIWDGLGRATCLSVYNGSLMFGSEEGNIYVFCDEGDDDGRGVTSFWQSRTETAGASAMRKSVKKGGCAVLLKKIPNSRVEIWAKADDRPETKVCEINSGGLDFTNFNFASLSFTTGDDNLAPVPLYEKVFKTLTLTVKSERPFGLGYLGYNASIVGYIK